MKTIPTKENLSIFITGIAVYSIFCGFCFQFGYWSEFDINIFGFMNFIDILFLSANIFVPFSITIVILLSITYLITTGEFFTVKVDKLLSNTLVYYLVIIIFATFVIIIPIYLINKFNLSVSYSLVISILLCTELVFISTKKSYIDKYYAIGGEFLGICIILAQIIPLIFALKGNIDAVSIKNGVSYQYIETRYNDKLAVNINLDSNQRIKYLGHSGTYIFLLLPDGSTITTTFDYLGYVPLKKGSRDQAEKKAP